MGLAEHHGGHSRAVRFVDLPVPAGGDHRPGYGGAVLHRGQIRSKAGGRRVRGLSALLPGQLQNGAESQPDCRPRRLAALFWVRCGSLVRDAGWRYGLRPLCGLLLCPDSPGGGAVLAVPAAGAVRVSGAGAVPHRIPTSHRPSAQHCCCSAAGGTNRCVLRGTVVAGGVYAHPGHAAHLLVFLADFPKIFSGAGPEGAGGPGRGIRTQPERYSAPVVFLLLRQ